MRTAPEREPWLRSRRRNLRHAHVVVGRRQYERVGLALRPSVDRLVEEAPLPSVRLNPSQHFGRSGIRCSASLRLLTEKFTKAKRLLLFLAEG